MDFLAKVDSKSPSPDIPLQTASFITACFHQLFYWSERWKVLTYKGIGLLQNPMDMWVKQEIVHYSKPEVIVETGTMAGGQAFFFCDTFPGLKVITIDTQQYLKPIAKHKNITYIKGSSIDPDIVKRVGKMVKGKKTMVILDSDHAEKHVFQEMEAYAGMVSKKHYMIVEDTNLGGNPIVNTDIQGRGPIGAVEAFLQKYPGYFTQDFNAEKYLYTHNPGGWLRKT